MTLIMFFNEFLSNKQTVFVDVTNLINVAIR